MKTALTLASLLALALALPACASPAMSFQEEGATSEDFGRPGFYVAAAAVRGFEDFDTPTNTITASDGDVGFLARAGVRLGESAAVELSFEDAAGFNLHDGSVSSDIDIQSVVAQGKWYFSTGRIEPYLLGGVGWASADARDFDLNGNAAFLRAGVGLDIYLTRGFAFFGEVNYNYMTGELRDLDHYDAVVGLLLKF